MQWPSGFDRPCFLRRVGVEKQGYAGGVLEYRFDDRKGRQERVSLLGLDFFLAQHRSESLIATLVESDCEFCSLAALVLLASHLPSLYRRAYFFFTFGTFRHNIPFLYGNMRST